MKKIIITPRSLSKGDHPLLAHLRSAGYELVFPAPGVQPNAEQLAEVIGDAVGYLAGVEKIDAPTLRLAKQLRVISRNGTGVDNIDLAVADSLGIRIKRAEGANARGVAELAFAYLLAAARVLPASSAELKAGRWTRTKGFELDGKTLGLVGCGKIGRMVARFALAFDMKVLGYDPFPDAAMAASPGFSYVSMEEIFTSADLISLHCPPAPGGKPVLDASVLSTMKKGVVVVNTARESLVDPDAMLSALDSGTVSWYGIDAFDIEPPTDLRIAQHPHVIATPHIGGFTDASIDRATDVAVDNLLAALKETDR